MQLQASGLAAATLLACRWWAGACSQGGLHSAPKWLMVPHAGGGARAEAGRALYIRGARWVMWLARQCCDPVACCACCCCSCSCHLPCWLLAASPAAPPCAVASESSNPLRPLISSSGGALLGEPAPAGAWPADNLSAQRGRCCWLRCIAAAGSCYCPDRHHLLPLLPRALTSRLGPLCRCGSAGAPESKRLQQRGVGGGAGW